MRFARTDKDYLGRDKTLNERALPWVCAYLEIDPDGLWSSDGHGGEAVLHGRQGRRLDRLGRLWPHGRQDPGLRLHQAANEDQCRASR
jgi:hypothetical protein